jgi:membrane-associated HD superfamily phosphohydrolase
LEKTEKQALEEASDRGLNPTEAEQRIQELREKVRELEDRLASTPEKEELENKLQRQFEAFNTIRNELTAQRERQFDSEAKLQKEKSLIDRERQELRVTVEKLRSEYEQQLETMWRQYETMKEELSLGRSALDAAQVKLMMNGCSPVSENGFDWNNSEHEEEEEEEEQQEEEDVSVGRQLVPEVGKLPPLEKPGLNAFMEVPSCSGCLSDVINI